jgi:hypothetical protein
MQDLDGFTKLAGGELHTSIKEASGSVKELKKEYDKFMPDIPKVIDIDDIYV